MSTDARRLVGAGLLVAAIVLAIGSVLLWGKASDDAEADRLAAGYAQAISGEEVEAEDANRVPSLAVAGLAAVLFVGGVVVLATERRDG